MKLKLCCFVWLVLLCTTTICAQNKYSFSLGANWSKYRTSNAEYGAGFMLGISLEKSDFLKGSLVTGIIYAKKVAHLQEKTLAENYGSRYDFGGNAYNIKSSFSTINFPIMYKRFLSKNGKQKIFLEFGPQFSVAFFDQTKWTKLYSIFNPDKQEYFDYARNIEPGWFIIENLTANMQYGIGAILKRFSIKISYIQAFNNIDLLSSTYIHEKLDAFNLSIGIPFDKFSGNK